MSEQCVNAMREQIGYEMTASNKFLAMGAFFSRDSINRLGFSDFFYDYADEEREHGISLAEYLVNRGELTTGINDLFQLEVSTTMKTKWPIFKVLNIQLFKYIPDKTEWTSVTDALDDGIVIEGDLTGHIRNVIDVCEHADNFEDYAVCVIY